MAKLEIENTQDSTATGVVVQCPYSAWWVIGWHRAAIWRLYHEKFEVDAPSILKAKARHAAAIAKCETERSGYADGERWTPAYMTDTFEPLASADGSQTNPRL